MKCPIRNVYCDEHDFVHGREAEELRSGVENLIRNSNGGKVSTRALQRLLDRVDARDSLAWREASDDGKEEATADEHQRGKDG